MSAKQVEDVPEYTSGSGKPDALISENEARLWLLSAVERRSGNHAVRFDEESQRWVRASGAITTRPMKPCGHCGRSFEYERSTARWCSDLCRKRSTKARHVPANAARPTTRTG